MSDPMNQQSDLKREIGLIGLSANIINIVVGAGIFVLPAVVAAGLGSASIFAYLFCGFLIILLMLCFAEVGSQITETGGVYTYIEKSFGRYPGFLTSVLLLIATISADAAIANAIASIISKMLPVFEETYIRIPFFALLFTGLAYINIIGVKKGVAFVKTLTILKLTPLLLIVLLGFKDVVISNLYWERIPSISEIGETSLVLYFAFTGAGSALSISGEVKNPSKTTPSAIFLSVFSILGLYVLVQTVSQGVLGDSLATFKENPLGEVASKMFGPIGFVLLTIGAGVSMFGGLSSKILSVPRVLFAASKDNIIPIHSLSAVHKKYATPYISIIVYAILCFILASIGGFKQLAIVSSATSLLISLGICLAVIKLRIDRKKTPSTKPYFKVPGAYTIPILASFFILWFLSNLSQDNIIGVFIFIAVLSILYFVINTRKRMNIKKKDVPIK